MKEIYGYDGAYLISDNGEIYSTRNNRIIRPFIASGYEQVELNFHGIAKKHLVHRLVAEAYIPNPYNLPCVNHIDGDKLNNSISNLEWCSYSENMIHASSMGLLHNPTKLTIEQVRYIRLVYTKGDPDFGLSALGRKFGVDHKTIWHIVNNKTWRNIE